ncbi:PREDICTED: nuclear pore complex protein NUP1 [Nelumbo nucifera]|uniref:Nuclear pore complex protein NUP1-like n=2 Tax=Nelumbo nucifera TaxID=4432 RepID=A0A822Y594_NELNU|nr:PREDICTED: nuclear pore complex protein NUP1 [Nelumbo nucifera]DAD27183.1 TPA_asm: hypothetical protein HUJ06_028651 [Nelumbo nucifera]
MEIEDALTSLGPNGDNRGAGGKLRKSARKPPATPYARPANQTQTGRSKERGWFSKLLDPASRLVSSGGTRLFPSFFSKTNQVETPAVEDPEMKQDPIVEDPKRICNIQVSRSKEEGGPNKEAGRSNYGGEVDELAGDKMGSSSNVELSKIEQLVKEKTFSRDELNRLTEILRSRIVDISDVDGQRKENQDITSGPEAAGGILVQNNLRTPVRETAAVNLHIGGAPNSVFRSTIHDDVGSSPVDIAKAYMETLTSDSGLHLQSRISKDEKDPVHIDDFSSKRLLFSSPSPKSPMCWPGAMVQDQLGYLTPQIQRNRIGLHNLPRTPYSRTVYSRSSSKMIKTGNTVVDDHTGTIGPIRRIRQKFISTGSSREHGSSRPSSSAPLWSEGSDAFKGFSPTVKRTLDPGASTSGNLQFHPADDKAPTSSTVVPTVHPQSSKMARKILEHLDRTIPTLKEKSDEIKLATAWKKPPCGFTKDMVNGQFIGSNLEAFDTQKSDCLLTSTNQGGEDGGSSFLKVHEQKKSNETATSESRTSASGTVPALVGFGSDGTRLKKPSMDSQVCTDGVFVGLGDGGKNEKSQPFPLHNCISGQEIHRAATFESLNVPRKTAAQSSGSKLGLTSTSLGKVDQKCTISPDNGSGFSFPVPVSSGVLSEPPTPTIAPSLSARAMPEFEGTTVPSYSFGSKKSGQVLVFKFPSTSTSAQGNASTPKFKFGSDKVARVSFRSVGKDAVCY